MDKTIFLAKNFNNRQELEIEVKKVVELSPELKLNFEIKGKKQELAKLQLSYRTLFYGIKCIAEDESPPQKQLVKPQRGEIFISKLNGQIKDLKNE